MMMKKIQTNTNFAFKKYNFNLCFYFSYFLEDSGHLSEASKLSSKYLIEINLIIKYRTIEYYTINCE